MSEIVPFTDPGGERCCCASDCLVDIFEAGNYPNFVGTWAPITEGVYQTIFSQANLATLIFAPNLDIEIRRAFSFQVGGVTPELITTFAFVEEQMEAEVLDGEQECFYNFRVPEAEGAPVGAVIGSGGLVEISTLNTLTNVTTTDIVYVILQFRITLATVNNQRYISFAGDQSVVPPNDPTQRFPAPFAIFRKFGPNSSVAVASSESLRAYLLEQSGLDAAHPCSALSSEVRADTEIPVNASIVLPGGQVIQRTGGIIHCADSAQAINFPSVTWSGTFNPTLTWMSPPP